MIQVTGSNDLGYWEQQAGRLGDWLVKQSAAAADSILDTPHPSYDLTGLFYVSTKHDGKPWGLLSVPNMLVRGAFDALHAPGIELPLDSDGRLSAHITCLRPGEIEQIGGPEKLINDRGKPFRYSLGRLVSFTPTSNDVTRIFAFTAFSSELQKLRVSHGLPPLSEYPFHITVGRVRKATLARNDVSKNTAAA